MRPDNPSIVFFNEPPRKTIMHKTVKKRVFDGITTVCLSLYADERSSRAAKRTGKAPETGDQFCRIDTAGI